MSEWEEFCESRGMNAGSSDDYDRMLDALDDSDDGLKRSIISKLPTEEVTSTVGKDELIACLIQGVAEGGVDVYFKPTYFTLGQYHKEVLDGLLDEPQSDFFLRLRSSAGLYIATSSSAQGDIFEHDVPISFLIDALRKGRAPLMCDEGWWVAWDDRQQCLKISPDALEFHWRRALVKKPIDSMDEREQNLMRLLNRAILSTDHGKKPLLIECEYLNDALHRREIEFDLPKTIAPENLDRFALVYYDAAGVPRSLPLKQVVDFGFPISTKYGAYIPTDGYLVPCFCEAQLIAGAFLIATKFNPNELKWFFARDRGSIFHSAIEQIEAPKIEGASRKTLGSAQWRDPDIQVYLASNSVEALGNAKKIHEWAAELGTVYLTADWHPLDSKYVTTPELYVHAIATLNRFGYEVRYGRYGEVEVKRASGENTLVLD